MKLNKVICMVLPFAAATVLSGPDVSQAQTACKPYTVNAPILQVRKDADTPGVYVTALQEGDTVCVSDEPTVGPQRLGLVVHKIVDGAPVAVGGWASVIFMTPQDGDAASAPASPAPQAAAPAAPKQQAAAPADTAKPAGPATQAILRFDQPVPYGAHQVRGKTLKELVEGKPMFAPIEGLPEELWQKKCSSCHNWDAKLLCEQGQSYIPRAAEVFRHQHPYGGAYKLSLMRWAKTGCK